MPVPTAECMDVFGLVIDIQDLNSLAYWIIRKCQVIALNRVVIGETNPQFSSFTVMHTSHLWLRH